MFLLETDNNKNTAVQTFTANLQIISGDMKVWPVWKQNMKKWGVAVCVNISSWFWGEVVFVAPVDNPLWTQTGCLRSTRHNSVALSFLSPAEERRIPKSSTHQCGSSLIICLSATCSVFKPIIHIHHFYLLLQLEKKSHRFCFNTKKCLISFNKISSLMCITDNQTKLINVMLFLIFTNYAQVLLK